MAEKEVMAMAPFRRKELRVRRENLYNLTDETLFVYSTDGQILTLAPESPPPIWEEGVCLIAKGETLEELSRDYRAKWHLLTTSSTGVGRNGILVTTLILYSDSSYRVFPISY